MKKVILSVLLLGIIMGLQAQELKVINLYLEPHNNQK